MTVDEFFIGFPEGRPIFEAINDALARFALPEVRVSKSQITFRRRLAFAAVWVPGKYLRGRVAPLVLSVYLSRRDSSSRWKEVVQPAPGRYTHHLEIFSPAEVDGEVIGFLMEAWERAA